MKKSILLLLLFISSISVAQIRYSAKMDISSAQLWSHKDSKISCTLSYVIEGYGRADFTAISGHDKPLSLEIVPKLTLENQTSMRFISAAPDWKSGDEELLGTIKLYRGFNPFVGNTVSWRVLKALYDGNQVLMPFTDTKRYNNETIIPTMSPIGFRNNYDEFKLCINSLIDVNFNDISMLPIFFMEGSSKLTNSSQVKFNEQLTYMKYDKSINSINIKIFTFGQGDEASNDKLALDRLEALKSEYKKIGFEDDSIYKVSIITDEKLSASTRSKPSDDDARKVIITLDRDPLRINRDLEIKMPDIGVQE